MILLTLGTNRYPFERLAAAVDAALCGLKPSEPLVVQCGSTAHAFRYPTCRVFPELPFPKLRSLYRNARLIVGHAGAGSIMMACEFGGGPYFAVPRRSEFGEHVDNHQVWFFRSMNRTRKIPGTLRPDPTGPIAAFLQNPPARTAADPAARIRLVAAISRFTDEYCGAQRL